VPDMAVLRAAPCPEFGRSGMFPNRVGRTYAASIMTEARAITLDQFLKHRNVVDSGGDAKHVIQAGLVRVNGETETRRGRKLMAGDYVEMDRLPDALVVTEQEGGAQRG